MCLVTESGSKVTGFGCAICRMTIFRHVSQERSWREPRQPSGSVETECDPLVAEWQGSLSTICHQCASRHFPGQELPSLSESSLAGFREGKLASARRHFKVDQAVFCDILNRSIRLSARGEPTTV